VSDFRIAEPDAALIRLENSTENFHEGALAGAVVANQSHDLPGYQIQRNILQSSYSAEILGKTDGPNYGLRVGTSSG
jgi:hypothetical protein